MQLERFKRSLESSTIVKMGSYDYFVHPISDGVPRMDPMVLAEVLDAIKEVGDFHCDLIVTPEAMGLAVAAPLALELGIPYSVIRKKKYGLPGEVKISQVTGYSRSEMYMNGVGRGERVTIIDDVISTGGTLLSIIEALRSVGADIVDIIVVIEKGGRKAELEKEARVRIKSLVKVEVRDGRLFVIS
jgi:adenine phosphoribosyltransferase